MLKLIKWHALCRVTSVLSLSAILRYFVLFGSDTDGKREDANMVQCNFRHSISSGCFADCSILRQVVFTLVGVQHLLRIAQIRFRFVIIVKVFVCSSMAEETKFAISVNLATSNCLEFVFRLKIRIQDGFRSRLYSTSKLSRVLVELF